MSHKLLTVLGLTTALSLAACKNKGEDSSNPDEIELPPEREVADKAPKPKHEPEPFDKVEDEKVTAQKVDEPTAPAVTPPQDRDQNLEKAKMKRSREKSGKAKQLLRTGQDDKAIAEARNALRDHEQNVEAMLVIAEAFYKQGKHELVLSVTGSILKVDAKVLSPEEKSQAYNLMAFAYLQAGQRSAAFQSFKSAAEADEHNAAAWNNLGVQYMWRGDYATAETCFEYAVSLDDKFAEAVLNHGAALRANGKLPEAEQAFKQVLKLRPDWAEVHFNLGVLYLDAEQIPNHDEVAKLDAAIKEFETYKSLVAKGKTSIERSKQQRGPTDAMGNELVSVAQAELYIKSANKGIESEERRLEREAKRKQREAEKEEEEEPGDEQPAATEDEAAPSEPAPSQPAQPQQPGGQAPPSQPAQPQQPPPSQPAQPQQPGGQAPSQPAQPPPSQPSQPSQPQKPGGNAPSQPSQPQKPGEQPPPSQPQQPQKPGAQQPSEKPQSPQKPQQPSPQKPQKPGG